MALTWTRNGLWALLVLVIGGGGAYALLVGKPEPEPEAAPQLAPPAVEVIAVEPRQRMLSVESQGTVRPLREVRLMSQVSGRVARVSDDFSAGSFFTAGEELLKIEDVDYRLQIARARSQVAQAEQVLAEEKGRALQAQREWRDLGSAEANALFLRKPQIAAAEAALQAAKADLEAARLDLQRTSVSVPFSGRISEKNVDIGQFVSPGTPLATVYATDAVEVRLPLTGRQVALLDLPLSYQDSHSEEFEGIPVVLRARFANRDWQWPARVVRTDASIDEASRVVYAVAVVTDPFARDVESGRPPLSPGQFVHATISGRALSGVVELPRLALRSDNTVLVVDVESRTREKPVHVLTSDSQRAWVQGLERGDRVVVGDAMLLSAGTEVSVESEDAIAAGVQPDSGEQPPAGGD